MKSSFIQSASISASYDAMSGLILRVGTLHLFDLIKEMYGYKTVSLTAKDKEIADLQFEYIFRYGVFGYGYSHELEQNDILVSNTMKESMFFKREYRAVEKSNVFIPYKTAVFTKYQ